MKLRELLECIEYVRTSEGGIPDVEVTGITVDSRRVEARTLFVALRGEVADGRDFIRDAARRGAVCAVTEEMVNDAGCAQVVVRDSMSALARLSDAFFGAPSSALRMVGVTGTNGKTTVAYLIESIFKAAGLRSGLVGTVNYRYGSVSIPAPLTTPQAPELQALLREMVDTGTTHCVMEVSSHALVQKRVEGCRFDVKIFTNLSPEHLDYHGTMEEYFRAKSLLFSPGAYGEGISVINMDDERGGALAKRVKDFFGYSLKGKAEIHPVDCDISAEGIEAVLNTPAGAVKVSSPLVGEFNMYNIMAAVGGACALGLAPDAIERGIRALHCVPGRLQRICPQSAIRAYVDYAHTPDALERALNVLSGLKGRGRLITVFGCGGNRDRAKRPLMGSIATKISDVTIITSDNPRDEDPLEIIAHIERGICGVRRFDGRVGTEDKGYLVIPDRGEAIAMAVEVARAGDTVLVAGKGHEDYQIVRGTRRYFDDRKVLEELIGKGVTGRDRFACRG